MEHFYSHIPTPAVLLIIMDPNSLNHTTHAQRKVKFAPKAPVRRAQRAVVPKIEVVDDAEAAEAKELMQRFNDGLVAGKPKDEKKSAPSQVAFGHGASGISKSYPVAPKRSIKPNYQGLRMEQEYKDPWNYYGYYPVTLPLRRPYSGNPDLLDEAEFGRPSESITFDGNVTNTAMELGLMEEDPEMRMLFVQLPMTMPMVKQSVAAAGQETANNAMPPSGSGPVGKTYSLNELPAGLMGKMMVYRSGKVKLKLGDTLYDVTPGSDCVFAQDVVAINTEEKHCCVVGELNKRATITPDVSSILDSITHLV
ncbi:hypothetical protein Nepgr_015595 [Nepenthes gracilis]|uniref:DNA-directed RNA polymerase III subunit RPC4 n=1 Tax=Nepenthes gracilis TaxID=150966 RepID=A0AAD3XR89_NEPGR|nr:hypothetical protein Nepgr_015595 [Nepenthes gracilis]